MREITETKTFKVYEIQELSQQAKEKVWSDMLHTRCELDTDVFTDSCITNLQETKAFEDDTLKIYYYLGHCQGDGASFVGKFNKDIFSRKETKNKDLTERFLDNLTVEECEFLENEEYKEDYAFFIRTNSLSNHYSHYNTVDFNYDYCFNYTEYDNADELEEKFETILEKLNKNITDWKNEICRQFENEGYGFFYEEYNEETLIDMNEDCLFHENGLFYNYKSDIEN